MPRLSGITRVVADLERARAFYEGLLGLEPGPAFALTRWQAYTMDDGSFLAVGEAPGSTNEVALAVPDVEALWERVKERAEVVEPLARTPWGTYRFVLRDPDGYQIAFSQAAP
jgi:predicted enzyme related to lactoylglutathione lyase